MSILPRRFRRLKEVLNHRMADLTVLLEHVEKPHNLSAILRSCDAVGAMSAHAVNSQGRPLTFNKTAQGSQKWIELNDYPDIENAVIALKEKGFRLFGTYLGVNANDYRNCDFTGPTAFVIGSEKMGISCKSLHHVDEVIYIPMKGMVQSLNVSVATATLLFEALRQRHEAGQVPTLGEGLKPEIYKSLLFKWAYPEVAEWCKQEGIPYPELSEEGEILQELPRTVKMRV